MNRILVVLLLLCASPAVGAPIEVRVTGAVTDWDGALGVQFAVGDELDAVYSYDPDAEPINLTTYPLLDRSGSLGDYAFDGTGLTLVLGDNHPQSGDQIFVNAFADGADVGLLGIRRRSTRGS